MSATFGCPHCGATYPVKPVLIGRPVRCTTCKNAFRLRPDGIADKVESMPAPAPTQPPPAPAVTVDPVTPPPPTRPSPAPARVEPPATTAVAANAPRSGPRLNSAQEQARRSLAANLSAVAEQALRAEEKKQSSQRLKKQSDRLARQQAEREGGVGDIGPAVLSGYGQREARNSLVWALGCGGAIAFAAVIALMITWTGPRRQALDDFTEPVANNSHGYRRQQIVERGWLTSVAPVTRMDDARIAGAHDLQLAAAKPLFDDLAAMQLLADKPVWAPPESASEIARRWDGKKSPADNVTALTKDGKIRAIAHSQAIARLEEAGIQADEAELVLRLLGANASPAGADVAKRLRAGEMPARAEIAGFAGVDGMLLVDFGGTYKQRPVEYEGRLMRLVGSDWPGEWRILELRTRSREQ